MSRVSRVIRMVMPRPMVGALRRVLGRPDWENQVSHGWRGDYPNWAAAAAEATGYDAETIISRTLQAARLVRDGKAAFERDSVVFEAPDYNWPLLACLMHVAAAMQGRLRIIDMGGALGSTYFQNRRFLASLDEVAWCVVEQGPYVEAGRREFEDGHLMFRASFDEAVTQVGDDAVVLMSGFLAYIECPYDLLARLARSRAPYLVCDRAGFTLDDRDRLTVQHVPPCIYPASYPCWFLSRTRFLTTLAPAYEPMAEFLCPDQTDIPSEYRGFLLRRREP